MHHNFETTYRTVDGRLTRGGMAFDSPSHSRAGTFVTKGGSAISRRDWPKFKGVFDDVSATNMASGGGVKWGPAQWDAAHARHAVHDAIEEACSAHGLGDAQRKALLDLVDQHLQGEARNEGAAATDKSRGAGARDDDDETELDEKIREYLSGHGLADDDVEKAIEIARRDREEARELATRKCNSRRPRWKIQRCGQRRPDGEISGDRACHGRVSQQFAGFA